MNRGGEAHTNHPLAESRELRDLRRSPFTASDVDEVLGEWVPEMVAHGRSWESDEVSRFNLVVGVIDLDEAAPGDDEEELFFGVVPVVDEGLLSGRDP